MANELQVPYPTGKTLYTVVFNATGQAWNTATPGFENVTSANWAHYAIALSEQATATGLYEGSFPAVAAGSYGVVAYRQAGGSPAVGDLAVATEQVEWDGTQRLSLEEILAHLGAGSGTTAVTDQSGGSARSPSNMTVENASSQPILGAIVQAYLAAAYTANPATAAVIAETTTNVNGGWTLNLPTGATYTLVFTYSGDQSATGSVTV
jgi:hypothetical protein